ILTRPPHNSPRSPYTTLFRSRCAAPGTLARRPDSSAQRVERVGAPVQTDTMVGLRRLGRESLFEYPRKILRRNADTVVPELQMRSEERRVGKECRCGWWESLY